MQAWVNVELAGADFGDARREKRLRSLVDALSRHPQGTFNQACRGAAAKKAAYRFFGNDRIDPQQVLAPHFERTWQRMGGHPLVVVVQDTTSLNYVSHPATAGLGPLENAYTRGFVLHSALAVSAEGEPLGLVHQETWARDEGEPDAAEGDERSWAQRESYKWQRTVETVAARRVEGVQYVIVGDRESDVYGLLASPRPAGIELVVRSAQDRRVEQHEGRLQQAASAGAAAGTMVVQVGRASKRAPRRATCEVRYRQLTLRPPKHPLPGVPVTPVTVWVVAIRERRPPRGEAPLEWVLITTWAVNSFEQAVRCAQLYSRRWLVERYHFVLKSGCRLEEKQLRERIRLERVQAVYAIVAWRLLAITYQARINPKGSCEPTFTHIEWQVLYAYLHRQAYPAPQPSPTMEQAVQWVAKLGGFWGRRGDGAPGVKVLWQGLTKLHALVDGFLVAQILPRAARSG
jgi:hypothetical protein